MGTSAPAYMNSTSFFKTFKSQFRPIEISGEKVDGQVYICDANQEMIIEYPTRIIDEETDELWHQSQSMIYSIQAPYIINYYGSSEKQSKEMCSSYSMIFSYYEYVPHNLLKEINERKENQEQFSEKEIWYLLWSLTQALFELKQKGYNHKDLRPATVGLKRNGVVKLCPIGVLQDQKNSVARFVVENLQTYLPTALKKQLIDQQQLQINWNKIDSFALGHIILDLMILDVPVLIEPQQIAQLQVLCYNRFSQQLIRITEHLMLETDNQLLVQDLFYMLKPYSEKINNLQDFQINFEDIKQQSIPINNMSKLKIKQIIENSNRHSEILYESQQLDNNRQQQQLKINTQQQQQLILEQQPQQLFQSKQQQIQQQTTSNLQQQIQQQLQQPNLTQQTTIIQQPTIPQQIITYTPQQQQQILTQKQSIIQLQNQNLIQQQPQNIIQQQQVSPQKHVIIPRVPQQTVSQIQSPDLRKSGSPQPQQFVNQQPQLLQRLLMQSQQIPKPQQIVSQLPPQQLQQQLIRTPRSPDDQIKIRQSYYQPLSPPPPLQQLQNVYITPPPPNILQQQPQPPNILQQQPIQRPIIQQSAPIQLPIIYLNRPPAPNNYNQIPPGDKIPVKLAQTLVPMNDQFDREITVLEYKPQGNQPLKASNQIPQQEFPESSPQAGQPNNFDRIRNVIQDSDDLLSYQQK
ncbi:unnamed protein product (macronuclear) [Paramecium tetraurelia]|uniref:Protein kinase domain-containing protein n=1 Tax=Paramecium tetraurelia TaxID=5888 RepID=A0EE64_PARTE|nr:uncharacterized protein GSPATT00025925001 [Paramecium tetraurelia]CAK93581.1 unnamed protein product [Paramecium tetraurelia]|eukprot:XP_001460978.1 hypothetical protein (macronuclear) [Paramecium tetraurelia strain d4-2]